MRADARAVRVEGNDISSLQIRVQFNNGHELGPSKAELLDAIAIHGSITSAGRALGVSYKHAWKLVDDLNSSFAEPLVHKTTGGSRGGGAALTETGVAVLAAYRSIETKAVHSASADLRRLFELTLESREVRSR